MRQHIGNTILKRRTDGTEVLSDYLDDGEVLVTTNQKSAAEVTVQAPVAETEPVAPDVEEPQTPVTETEPIVPDTEEQQAPIVETEQQAPIVEGEQQAPIVEGEQQAPIVEGEQQAPIVETEPVALTRKEKKAAKSKAKPTTPANEVTGI